MSVDSLLNYKIKIAFNSSICIWALKIGGSLMKRRSISCPIWNMKCCFICSADIFCFLAGQGTRTGAIDQGAAPGEPSAVHPANGNQGDGAAGRPRGGGGPTCGARERCSPGNALGGREKGRAAPLLPLNAGTARWSECSLSEDISKTLKCKTYCQALLFIPKV